MEFSCTAETLAKIQSLETIRRDVNYNFKTLSVKANTIPNNGIIIMNTKVYLQKCFFISVIHGFIHTGINHLNVNFEDKEKINLYSYKLAAMFRMLNDIKIDTNCQNHSDIINRIAKIFAVKLEVYIGNQQNGNWYTTPDPSVVIGENKNIIRILNKGDHFEFLKELETGFIENLTESRINGTIIKQEKVLETIKRDTADRRLAQRIYAEENSF